MQEGAQHVEQFVSRQGLASTVASTLRLAQEEAAGWAGLTCPQTGRRRRRPRQVAQLRSGPQQHEGTSASADVDIACPFDD